MMEDEKGTKQYAQDQNESIERENNEKELDKIELKIRYQKQIIEIAESLFNKAKQKLLKATLRRSELIDILK